MGFASIRGIAACGISVLALGYATGALAQEIDDSEIVVTAAKREQSVRDVSGSVTAVSEATLQKLNAQSLSDYITRVPGVIFNDYQPGVSEVVIRGVASSTYHEANQATTGYYFNEVPLIERSEEHTSELQSLMRISYAVFCLNKKQKHHTITTTNTQTT